MLLELSRVLAGVNRIARRDGEDQPEWSSSASQFRGRR